MGVMLGIISPDLLSGANEAHEVVWRLHPHCRGQGAGEMLMREFEKSAVESGCKRIIFSMQLRPANADSMRKKYARAGYTPLCEMQEKRL
jgi:ribosomal protein S18 acetylase RimI-like enzyme